jgi:hypothetical protein
MNFIPLSIANSAIYYEFLSLINSTALLDTSHNIVVNDVLRTTISYSVGAVYWKGKEFIFKFIAKKLAHPNAVIFFCGRLGLRADIAFYNGFRLNSVTN